jgi:hypothetical protein
MKRAEGPVIVRVVRRGESKLVEFSVAGAQIEHASLRSSASNLSTKTLGHCACASRRWCIEKIFETADRQACYYDQSRHVSVLVEGSIREFVDSQKH